VFARIFGHLAHRRISTYEIKGRSSLSPRSLACPSAEAVVTTAHAARLSAEGLVVIDGALPPDVIALCRAEAEALREAGDLHVLPIHQAIGDRQDEICFLRRDGEDPSQGRHSTISEGGLLAGVRLLGGLAARLSLLGPLEVVDSVQLACYPAGARYSKHYDGTPLAEDGGSADDDGGNRRLVTAILYLNPDWSPDDGGRLRAYPPSGGKRAAPFSAPIEIEPVAGRLVVFMAREVEHEVLLSRGLPRMALTQWIFRG